MRRTTLGWALLGLAVWIIALVVIQHHGLDLAVTRMFFDRGPSPFPLADTWFWEAVDDHGPKVAIAVGVAACVVLAGSFRSAAWCSRRSAALYVALCVLTVPGIVVNGILKNTWGRARPRNVAEFQPSREPDPVKGPYQYREWWQPGPTHEGASFPSGHTAAACAMFSLVVVARGRRRWWAWAFALPFCGVMVTSRLIDGAHFVTDVGWSLFLTLNSLWVLAWWVLRGEPEGSGNGG